MRTAGFKVTTAAICPYIVFICMLYTILTTESKHFLILDAHKVLGQIQDCVSPHQTKKKFSYQRMLKMSSCGSDQKVLIPVL